MSKRTREFSQVCVWRATTVVEKEGDGKIAEFTEFMASQFGTRVLYLEEVVTLPGQGGEGGRNDVLFAVHTDDVMSFTLKRIQYHISWIEDFFDSGSDDIYEESNRIREQYYGEFKEPKSATGPWGTGAVPMLRIIADEKDELIAEARGIAEEYRDCLTMVEEERILLPWEDEDDDDDEAAE